MMLAHIMGIPAEETLLQLAPAGAATLTALALPLASDRATDRASMATVKTSARSGAETALLDAAERLLVESAVGITTRRLAEEAGVNHGLVHYYFGSMDEVFVAGARAVHRAADRAPARDVRGRRPVHREVAYRLALPGGGYRGGLPEDLDGAAGPLLEPPGAAPADRAGERRVARGPARGFRARGATSTGFDEDDSRSTRSSR